MLKTLKSSKLAKLKKNRVKVSNNDKYKFDSRDKVSNNKAGNNKVYDTEILEKKNY